MLREDQWAYEAPATARPHLPGVTHLGRNRPSAEVLATNGWIAIGRTVPTGGAPGRQHFLLTPCDIKDRLGYVRVVLPV